MQTSATFWDKAAAKYAKSPIEDMDAYLYTLDRTRSYLRADDRILEVGCGTGSTALLLSENVAHITASDSAPNMIAIAKSKAADKAVKNVDFLVAEATDDTVNGAPFDALLAHNLIHLLPNLDAFMDAASQLVQPGGVFISKTVCQIGTGAPLKYRLIKYLLPVMQWLGKAPYVNFMDAKTLEDKIQAAGFEIIETGNYPITAMSRYIVARKI